MISEGRQVLPPAVRSRKGLQRDIYVNAGIAMAQRETFSAGIAGDASVNAGQLERSGDSPRPSAEEGHRLIRAFLSIEHATLRDAIVNLVLELSALSQRRL